MTTYFDHVARGTCWDVLELPPAIEVDETETEELLREYEEWTKKRVDSLRAQPLASLLES